MIRSVVVVVALITSGGSALAQTPTSMVNCAAKAIAYADAVASKDNVDSSMPEQCGTIEIEVGHTRLLKLDRPFKSVIVGDPDIADAVVQDQRTLLITAKAWGEKDTAKASGEKDTKQRHETRTNLLLLDNANEPMYSVELAVTNQPAGKGDLVQSLGRVRVYAGRRKEIADYTPYACSSADCIRLKMETQGELSKEINNPTEGGSEYTSSSIMSSNGSTTTFRSQDELHRP
jgi:Pilus formation protein N terminal region